MQSSKFDSRFEEVWSGSTFKLDRVQKLEGFHRSMERPRQASKKSKSGWYQIDVLKTVIVRS